MSTSKPTLAHANDSRTTGERADARRPASLDFCRVDAVSRVGVSTEGLRPAAADKPAQKERDEASYVIEAGLKMLKVLEALEGRSYEPVSIQRVAQRTGFSRDICRRSLITLKRAGWAKQTVDGWMLGAKAENLARRLGASLIALSDPQFADRKGGV